MHAAVRQKSEDVQRGIFTEHVVDCFVQGSISAKNAVFDGFGNARQFLIDDAARTDIQVSDLGVSHLPFGKTNRKAARPEADMRISFKYFVEIRRVRRLDCISVFRWIQAEAVEYHEHGRLWPYRCVLCHFVTCFPLSVLSIY